MLAGTLGYADFITVKAGTTITNDCIIAIFELKKKETQDYEAVSQLIRYMEFAEPKTRDEDLSGFLVTGNQTTEWKYRWVGEVLYVDQVAEYETDSLQFRRLLHEIAKGFWS